MPHGSDLAAIVKLMYVVRLLVRVSKEERRRNGEEDEQHGERGKDGETRLWRRQGDKKGRDYWICIAKRMDPIFINQYKHELRVRAQIIAVYSHRHDTLLLMGTCSEGQPPKGSDIHDVARPTDPDSKSCYPKTAMEWVRFSELEPWRAAALDQLLQRLLVVDI